MIRTVEKMTGFRVVVVQDGAERITADWPAAVALPRPGERITIVVDPRDNSVKRYTVDYVMACIHPTSGVSFEIHVEDR